MNTEYIIFLYSIICLILANMFRSGELFRNLIFNCHYFIKTITHSKLIDFVLYTVSMSWSSDCQYQCSPAQRMKKFQLNTYIVLLIETAIKH